VERLVDHPRQVLDPLHQIVVLGARAGDADGVGLLEGVRADQVGGDLAGDDHQGDGVQQGVDDAGDGVGGPGAGGHQAHARLAGGAGVALGRMGRALFVAHQDVMQARLVEQGVVDRQDRAARIAEDGVYALIHQGAHDDLGARQGLNLRFGVEGLGGHGGCPSGTGSKRVWLNFGH